MDERLHLCVCRKCAWKGRHNDTRGHMVSRSTLFRDLQLEMLLQEEEKEESEDVDEQDVHMEVSGYTYLILRHWKG